MTVMPFRRQVTIEWGDCDPAGIVHYPRYFAMFDVSTAHLFQVVLGCSKREMLRRYDIIGFPMVETRASFFIPSKFGDTVTIESYLKAFNRSSFEVSHRLLVTDGRLGIEASETRVWAGIHPDDHERIKGRAIPAEVVAAFAENNKTQTGESGP